MSNNNPITTIIDLQMDTFHIRERIEDWYCGEAQRRLNFPPDTTRRIAQKVIDTQGRDESMLSDFRNEVWVEVWGIVLIGDRDKPRYTYGPLWGNNRLGGRRIFGEGASTHLLEHNQLSIIRPEKRG